MKIQIIPETEEEKQKIENIEHSGIKEFLLFGNKVDADGQGVDIHEWSGSYRYLIGSMEFFTEVLHDERRERNSMVKQEEVMKQLQDEPQLAKFTPPNLKVVSVDQEDDHTPSK